MNNFSEYTTAPTYSKLIAAVKSYLSREDEETESVIPFFINAAEKTILRRLRMPSMEKIVRFKLSDVSEEGTGDFAILPLDYLEMKHVWTEAQTLRRCTFDQLLGFDMNYQCEEGLNTQAVWAINANRMYVRGVDRDQYVYMTYYADVPELHEANETNILLDLAPDAFLFLAVAEGMRWDNEPERAEYWEQQGAKRLEQILVQVDEAEYSGSTLVMGNIPGGGQWK